MSDDARVEAAALAIQRVRFPGDGESAASGYDRKLATAALAAADAVPGITAVNTNDLRTVLDSANRGMVSRSELHAYDRVRAEVEEKS